MIGGGNFKGGKREKDGVWCGDFIRKSDKQGQAFCAVYDKDINYAQNSVVAIYDPMM